MVTAVPKENSYLRSNKLPSSLAYADIFVQRYVIYLIQHLFY